MIAIKNNKQTYLHGDYHLVRVEGQVVAVIFAALEHTSREIHSGGNTFEVYQWETSKQYTLEDRDDEGNILLGKYNGLPIGLTLAKACKTKNAGEDMWMPIHKGLIEIESFSALSHPLKAWFGYCWNNYHTKALISRRVSLWTDMDASDDCDRAPARVPMTEANGFDAAGQDDLEEYILTLIPTIQERYQHRREARLRYYRSYNGNYLVHDEEFDTYTWYRPSGEAIKYTDAGEYLHIRQGERRDMRPCFPSTLLARLEEENKR